MNGDSAKSLESLESEGGGDCKLRFFGEIGDVSPFIELFSAFSDVYFFMKDREGKFVAANALQVEKMGLGREEDLIGRTDHDFFPRHLVAKYLEDDRKVMQSGEPQHKKVEMVSNPDGSISWHVTSKMPVFSKTGEAIGVVGVMRDLDDDAPTWRPYRQMRPAIDYVRENYGEPIEVAVLAGLVQLSVSQFERRFRQLFHLTPTRFVIRFRISRACRDLVNTDRTLTRIAHDCGFYDHSHFSREFNRVIGISPGEYRRQHGK